MCCQYFQPTQGANLDDDNDLDPDNPEGGDALVDPLISKEELNLTCYNLMIDVLCSQVKLQDVEK